MAEADEGGRSKSLFVGDGKDPVEGGPSRGRRAERVAGETARREGLLLPLLGAQTAHLR